MGVRMQLRVLLVAIAFCVLVSPSGAMQWVPFDPAPTPEPTSPPTPTLFSPAVSPAAPVSAAPSRRGQMPVVTRPEQTPVATLRPEQMPATPPEVTFSSGQLTITAHNSTLGDILRAVRNSTGAVVEVPANATERVAGNFGPGPARDVLSSLLNGSHFNYVLLGSATSADALERVILTVKSGATGQAAANAETASATPPAPANNPEMAAEDQPEPAAEEPNLFAEEPSTPDDQAPNPFGQPSANANTRTPEQMLQDLQRQQEVQQQIQQHQQQLGSNPGLQFPRGLPPVGFQPPVPSQPQ